MSVTPLETVTGPTRMYGPPVLVQVVFELIGPDISVETWAKLKDKDEAISKLPMIITNVVE